MPTAYLTRHFSFSAAHRLHNPSLSEAQNRLIYDKCNRANGHGHNYHCKITVRGPIDPDTGMVLNLSILKAIVSDRLEPQLDHKFLDRDVPFFSGQQPHSGAGNQTQVRPSTAENIALFIWNEVQDALAAWPDGQQTKGVDLFEVKVRETDKNAAVYQGEL